MDALSGWSDGMINVNKKNRERKNNVRREQWLHWVKRDPNRSSTGDQNNSLTSVSSI